MTTLFKPMFDDNSFEVFFRDAFNSSNKFFQSIIDDSFKMTYPVDIFSDDNGIEIDIAVVGADKDDISIEIENDILTVSYKKQDDQNTNRYYYKRGIAKRSFSFAWKISKGDLDNIDVSLDKGLLKIFIPWIKEQKKSRTVKIK